MNSFFLDASGLSKRYTLEVGVALVDQLFSRVPFQRLCCLMLGAAEVASVLVRRRNGGRLPPAAFAQGMMNLIDEIVNNAGFPALGAGNLRQTSTPSSDLESLELH
jgi:hypothetical protein